MKIYLGLFAAALGVILLYSGGTGHAGGLWTSLFGPGKGTGQDPVTPSGNGGGAVGDPAIRSSPGYQGGVPGNVPASPFPVYPGGIGGQIIGPATHAFAATFPGGGAIA